MNKGNLGILTKIHNVARRKLPQLAKLREQLNNAVVFAPMASVIEEILNDNDMNIKNVNNANTKTVIMIFMYLLNVIGLKQLPEEMQTAAKGFKKQGRTVNGMVTHDKYYPRYYEIVSLDAERLSMAEEMAEFFYEKKLTIQTFNREQLLKMCGEEESDRVFPDRKEEKVSELNEDIAEEFECVMNKLIEVKGWTNEKEVLEAIVIPDFDMKQRFRNTFKFIKSKKSEEIDSMQINDDEPRMLKWYNNFISKKFRSNLPIILDKYGIVNKRVNRKLKNAYNIPKDVAGFIYYIEVEEEEAIEHMPLKEDKATMIRRLKFEDSSLSYSKIANIAGCSKQYVSSILKK